jgi:hypothetical protein
MINIPVNRRVIVTTLNFAQITDRLENAIYDPRFGSVANDDYDLKSQPYLGKIQGFKFLATKIIGFKDFHLPIFLSPTIEGHIDSLHHGYEISLRLKLQNITFVLLLTWLGGLLTTISAILDNILTDARNYQYLATVETIAIAYILVLAYFYFAACREIKFFKTLFIKGFVTATQSPVTSPRSAWSAEFQTGNAIDATGQMRSTVEPVTGWLRQNLPSFPNRQRNVSDRPYPNTLLQRQGARTLLEQNLPSFPHRHQPERDR